MKPYLSYTAEDFACDEDFSKWVKYPGRYDYLESFWRQWLFEHPEKQDLIYEARSLVLAVLAGEDVSPGPGIQQAVWENIRRSTDISFPTPVVPLWKRWYSRAAVVALCLSVGWLAFNSEGRSVDAATAQSSPARQFVKHVNNAETPQIVILSDGSSIILQPHAVLEHPRTFASDIREVFLMGEAFFEVTRDPDRPFLVRSGEITTRVLGTSFTVRNVEGEDNVRVQVKSGKVSVFMATEKPPSSAKDQKNVDGVVLMPNQQVLYKKTEMKMTKSLVENPSVLILADRQNVEFEFADAPISNVFEAIEEAYGVEIVFDEQALSSCYLNASLDDVPLYDKLKLICKGINATYEIMDSHIIIYGKGCRQDSENPNPN